jgi:hypothetical protein
MLTWVRLARIARLGLGGVIIGSFVGVYFGAGLGLGYAAWVGHLSPALDGALLGGAAVALVGGMYGIILGITDRLESPLVPEIAPDRAPPAGCRDPQAPPSTAGNGVCTWPIDSWSG